LDKKIDLKRELLIMEIHDISDILVIEIGFQKNNQPGRKKKETDL